MARELDDPAPTLADGLLVAPQPRRLAPAALFGESIVEGREALGTRDGDQEVPPDEADQSLDLALVVALARPAEPVLEQIVGLKLREDARSLPLPIAQDAGNRQAWCCRTGWSGGRRRRRQTPRCGHRRMLRSSPPDRPQQSNHQCGEGRRQGSGSSVTRRRSRRLRRSPPGRDRGNGEWHEHLTRPKPLLTDIVLHDGAAGEPGEAVGDPLRRDRLVVAGPIVFQNPIDDPRERTQLRPPWRLAAAIPRRHRERQHLAYRLAVQPEHPRGLAGAHPSTATRPPDAQKPATSRSLPVSNPDQKAIRVPFLVRQPDRRRFWGIIEPPFSKSALKGENTMVARLSRGGARGNRFNEGLVRAGRGRLQGTKA